MAAREPPEHHPHAPLHREPAEDLHDVGVRGRRRHALIRAEHQRTGGRPRLQVVDATDLVCSGLFASHEHHSSRPKARELAHRDEHAND